MMTWGLSSRRSEGGRSAITAVYDLLEQRFDGLQRDRLEQRKLRRDLERQLVEAKDEKAEEEAAVLPRTARFAVEAKASGQAIRRWTRFW